ncbi:MAG TPA: EAL domain-containing protein [Rhizomicrobium sp.]|jgi:EAL domain-containing protein (putative c-di-GMP-specific phosphodiesterase class I)|nr:EAL domain-containing protein [Rhizomicrobium sp.]
MIDAARLLGFAFANADYLFEVDGNGTVVFATGAASEFVKGDVVGKPAARLFQTTEAIKFATLSRALGKGDRAGPFRLKLAGGKDVALSLFRLPQNGNQVSCTLSNPGARGVATTDPMTGLATRDGFLAAASGMVGENDALAMIDLPGLPKLCAGLGEEDSSKLLGRIGASFAKMGAKAAGRLSPSRFGIIADAVGGTAKLGAQIRAALAESGAGALAVEETLISLKGKDLSEGQRELVLRYVVEKFANGEWSGGAQADAESLFGKMMDETQQRLRMLTEAVADGAFNLAYQPIVNLATNEVSHYEALARFSGGDTGETIRFVEQLGISDAFDLAVAVKILSVAESKAGQQIAFNLSGRTICSAAHFGLLAGLLTRKRALSNRLLIEITETAEITDMDAAAKAVAALRALGYRVGLDDFGAGAASINYLHALPVDFVKFDGALIKKIGQSKRDDVLLTGLVKLCGELGVQTIAEFLETAEQAAAAKAMGFDLGQGYRFGAGTPELPPPAPKIAAKRKGVQESWG